MPILFISSSLRSLYLLSPLRLQDQNTRNSKLFSSLDKEDFPYRKKRKQDMAVEAQHMNLLHPKLLGNREMVSHIEADTNLYNTQMGYALPLSGTTAESLLPMYMSPAITDSSLPLKTTMKSDSGVTYNIPSSTRKRSRDSFNPFIQTAPQKNPNSNLSFLGEDLSCFVQHQQLDLDRLISQHMEKVRLEIEESRRKQARKMIQAIEVGMMKRLKAKQEELDKIGKLNYALEERVKSLCMENKIWRDLAQTNEATANALRTNLQQVMMAQGQGKEADIVEVDDAMSSCGSTDEIGGDEGDQEAKRDGYAWDYKGNRRCRNCWTEEACVVLLPCRHLCLCTTCGSKLHVCPVCNSVNNASVHVNFS